MKIKILGLAAAIAGVCTQTNAATNQDTFNDSELASFQYLEFLAGQDLNSDELTELYREYCGQVVGLQVLIGYQEDQIADLEAQIKDASKRLSKTEILQLENELRDALTIYNFASQQALREQKGAEESEFCKEVRRRVKDISSRICEAEKKYRDKNCGWEGGIRTVCDRMCFEDWRHRENAKKAVRDAEAALLKCIANNQGVGCVAETTAYLKAVAEVRKAERALVACVAQCRKAFPPTDRGEVPDPICEPIKRELEGAKKDLQFECSPYQLNPDGSTAKDQDGNPIPNPNAACPACQEVITNNYEPIKCSR